MVGYLLRTCFDFAGLRRDVTGIYSVLGAVSCFVPHALILSWVFSSHWCSLLVINSISLQFISECKSVDGICVSRLSMYFLLCMNDGWVQTWYMKEYCRSSSDLAQVVCWWILLVMQLRSFWWTIWCMMVYVNLCQNSWYKYPSWAWEARGLALIENTILWYSC